MRIICITLLLGLASLLSAQEIKTHQLQLVLLQTQALPESINDVWKLEWGNGIYYQRRLGQGQWALIGGIEYGNYRVRDRCPYCETAFEGEGKFREIRFVLGAKYQYQATDRLSVFVEQALFFANSQYAGSFDSKTSMEAVEVDNEYEKGGLITRLGAQFDFHPSFACSLMSALQISSGGEKSRTQFLTSSTQTSWLWMPVEIRLLYLF